MSNGNNANVWSPKKLTQISGDTKSVSELIVAVEGQEIFTLGTFVYALGTGALEVHKNGLLLSKGTAWVELTENTFRLLHPFANSLDNIEATGKVAIEGVVEVGQVVVVQPGYAASIDNTDPQRPIVSTEVGIKDAAMIALNQPLSAVIYATDLVTPIPEYIRSEADQLTYSVPTLAQGQTIISVVGNVLTASGGVYVLLSAFPGVIVTDKVDDFSIGLFSVGETVQTKYNTFENDGGGALYIIEAGNTGDGYVNHDTGANTAVLQWSGTLIAQQAGLVSASGVAVKDMNSMSDVLDAIATHISPDYTELNRRPVHKSTKVDLGSKPFRITRPFYQPAFTIWEQQVTPTFAWDGMSEDSVDETFIYCDWLSGEKECAWNFSGWWLVDKGAALTGDRINTFIENVESNDYNLGNISLTYGCECKLNLWTNKYIGASIGVFAATTTRYDIQSRGFLHAVLAASCWSGVGKLHSLSYHTGGYFYNTNKWNISGYCNLDTAGTPPVFDASTAPTGWFVHPVHNPPEYAYLTTGIYNAYSNAFNTDITTEAWDRARFGQNNKGIFENSPYIEGIKFFGIHCVNSEYTWVGGVRAMDPLSISLARPTGASMVVFEGLPLDGSGIQQVFSGDVTPTYSTSSCVVRLRSAEQCIYNNSVKVKYEFSDPAMIQIYVSDSGDDTNEGVNESHPVKTINVAVERAIEYDVKTINVDASSTVTFSDYAVLFDRELSFIPYNGTPALISPLESGTSLIGFRVSGNNSLKLDEVDTNSSPAVTPSASASGLIRIDGGNLSIHFKDSAHSYTNSSAMFSSGSNESCSTMNMAVSRSTFTGSIANNASMPRGVTKVILSSVDDLSGQFQSEFQLL